LGLAAWAEADENCKLTARMRVAVVRRIRNLVMVEMCSLGVRGQWRDDGRGIKN